MFTKDLQNWLIAILSISLAFIFIPQLAIGQDATPNHPTGPEDRL